MRKRVLSLAMMLALAFVPLSIFAYSGSGTSSSPYLIQNANDWNTFAAEVANGNSYSGVFFKLTSNISVTTMAGTISNPFSGTFDGNNKTITVNYTSTERQAALFPNARNLTIKNLKVAGNIETSNVQAGGFIGYLHENATITDCVSDVTINSTFSGMGKHGGFIGELDSQAHATFTNCVFTGRLLGTNTNKCGGFVGWVYSHYSYWAQSGTATAVFNNCIFAPKEVTIGVGDAGPNLVTSSATFCRAFPTSGASGNPNTSGVTINNCYYTQTFGTTQGSHIYAVSGGQNVAVNFPGEHNNTTGVVVSNYGLSCDGSVYVTNGDQTLSLDLNYTGDQVLDGFTASAGTLTGSSNPYSLAMGGQDIVITAQTHPGGGGQPYESDLHTLAYYGVGDNVEELVDQLYIERPNGAWMEPYHFQLYNEDDHNLNVVYIDFLHNNGYFSMDEETTEYPFLVPNTGREGAVDLYINTYIDWTDTEAINSLLAVNTDERSTHLYTIIAEPYMPYCPDVVEKAYNIGTLTTGQVWRRYASAMWSEQNPNVPYNLHANYDLPDFAENIPDGYDAVMKFTANHDILLNAYVNDAENGKVALYRKIGDEPVHPMADNNYAERPFHNDAPGVTGGELTVHDGTATNGYVPVYGFYTDAYLKCEMVYLASELSGMSGMDINSMKFYLSSPADGSWGNANFRVFMTEVSGTTVNAFNGPGTIVYEGALDGTQPEMTIEFTTPYHYNGGNLLVGVYNTTIGTYKSCSFYGENITGASYQGYNYSSLTSVSGIQRNFLPKTTFAYGSRADVAEYPASFSAGPVIENLNVLAGTYYLVASSTDRDFEVVINAEELPCPIASVTNIYPADNALDVPANDLTLRWTLDNYANEWRLVFGSTYYPEDEPEHPATYITEWSSDLQESFNISAALAANGEQLWENTNYFWRIEQRHNAGTPYECVTSGPVFGFTTSFDVPQNLQVNGGLTANIFETEQDVTLTWNRIYDRNRNNDRTFRRYRIYWNGELYDETTENDVTELSYTIPNSEFHYNMVPRTPEEFNVTAVYDEGESPMSNTAYVQVSGYGTVSGTAYEQDQVTPIGGVTVVINGTNEFGEAEEYTFTTDENGYYEGDVHVGVYSDAMAYMDGYQATQTNHALPFNIVYQQETPDVDFIIDEIFYHPAQVCAELTYVQGVQGDSLVHVWWQGWASEDGGFVPGGSGELTVHDGTATSSYIPLYGLWHDDYTRTEMVYPAAELSDMTNSNINSMKFYISSAASGDWGNATFQVYMKEVSSTTISGYSSLTDATLVYTGSLDGTGSEMTINFTTPYHYNGGNLMVSFFQTVAGTYHSCYFYGENVSGASGSGYNSSSASNATFNQRDFLAKTTFTYGGREVTDEMNRSLHHFNIYRTDCYNDGPYNSENTTFLASVWRPDTSYMDVQWPEVPVGVYKYGVSAVYQGNQADNPNNPRVDYPFEERESRIVWSNECNCGQGCIDKDMLTDITVNVVCNSADSPEGCVVSFTNLNEGEQNNHPQPSITLDGSGYQIIAPFRKGDYLVTVYLPGYELLQVEESIWGHRDLRYVLTEIIYGVKNLYVSRTGWAMWEPLTWEDYPIPEGAIVGPSIIDFETGDFSQYGFDNSGTYPWTVANEGRGYCMKSGNGGVANSTSSISATVNYTMAGTISFDYNSRGEGTTYDVSKFMIDGVQQFSYGAVGTWNTFTAEVPAGEHTFTWAYTKDGSVNPTGDCFLVDNINFNIGGSRAVAEERHLEGYKIMCTSLDDEPIFNHNTPVDQPFCQLTTVDPWSGQPMLIEGERYKVKVASIYSTGQSEWCEAVIWQYEPCDHWGPVDEVTFNPTSAGNHIEWVFDHGHNQWFDPNDPDNPDPQPGDQATIVVSYPEDIWQDGTGYQMLLDADATACGIDFQPTGGYGPTDYSNFEYTVPANAAYPANAGNIVGAGTSQSIEIPAGTYDWVMVNPTNGGGTQYIVAGNGNVGGRQDDYVFEAGKTYTFTMSSYYPNDGCDVVITDNRGNVCGFASLAVANNSDCRVNENPMASSAEIGLYQGGSFYSQYAEDGIMLNFLALGNVDLRAYLLYSITKDNSFSLMADSQYGHFVLTPANDKSDFMTEFESFYENATYQFSLLSKMDIYDRMSEWKSGVSSQDFLSITMDVALSNARVENDQCINSLPFCTSDVIEFEAANTDNTAEEEGMDDGCIGSSYNPSFYHMRIHDAGPFVIHMEATAIDPADASFMDVDFCMWGPYTEQEVTTGYACTHLTADKIMDCCYSASETENCYLGYPEGQHQHSTGHGSINYHEPQVGEYYILMVTNYSRRPCTINFTKTEGAGETDCDIVTPTNIIGFLITQDGEYLTIVGPDEREFTHEGEFGEHEYCVRPIYPGPAILPDTNYYFSMGCPVCVSTDGEVVVECEPGDPIYAELNAANDQVHLWWGEQPEPQPVILVQDDFEGYTAFTVDPAGVWTYYDGDLGTVYNYSGVTVENLPYTGSCIIMNPSLTNPEITESQGAHGGSQYMAIFNSMPNTIVNGTTTNDWVISPLLDNPTSLSFWARELTDQYGAEMMRVMYSTTTNDVNDFQLIQQESVTSTEWAEYTYELPAGTKYVAINCVSNDVFALFIDDVTIMGMDRANRDGEIVGYNIYRSTDNVDYVLIATVDGDVTEYFDAPGAGTYYYQVTALYADGCESDPAISGENPEQDYVVVGVTGVGENSDNVNLFPNPTKGNVTIQAMNMHRITVVSVLGQVVFDTELDQDEYVLNMSKFNTGMYMVRVYTDEGMTVKRVTVLH